jgi:hypothetical protein
MLSIVGRWRHVVWLHVVAIEGEVILVARHELDSLLSSHKPLLTVSAIAQLVLDSALTLWYGKG